ncbi:39S ribosomal protein L39, mitochondrial [Cimex lectularius]|uniref:Large ribosomal subunit protein mL39 n=1 Tax=Cimex lectularius TaxID=79782 RepID=A0A8I6RBJ8_CIMLE|nr:39S ribosomal protein L39, mitochondrial [Cimex lectularius]
MKVLTFLGYGRSLTIFKRFVNTAPAYVKHQNDVFTAEANRQMHNVGRIEKVEISYDGLPEKATLYMNRNISTPHDVALHISQFVAGRSALAIVDNQTPWDMHRPFEESCHLNFLGFNDSDPYLVNKAFWKSCSFLLGAVINTAFSDHIKVTLHSFPSPQITSGSFLYDASLSLDDWNPTKNELRVLSAEMAKLVNQSLPFERLQVSEEMAKEIFSDNKFKLQQIPNIANKSDGHITLYRVGTHIDISKGPLVGNSSFIGRCTIAAVHKIESEDGVLFRFQGVALPKGLLLNQFAYKIIEERAAKLNKSTFTEPSLEEQLA